jgi:putative ABC transport system substrate-binding protein
VVFEEWSPSGVSDWNAIQAASRSSGVVDMQAVGIGTTNDDLERALESALAARPQAVITAVAGGTIISATNQPAIITVVDFALQHGLPPAASRVDITALGGLLFYGPDLVALYRRATSYHADCILRGAKPADLPVEGPTAFDLIVNRTTGESLAIAIPPDFAAQVTKWVS